MAYAVDLAKPGGAWPKSSPSQSEIERVGRNPEFAADSALEREMDSNSRSAVKKGQAPARSSIGYQTPSRPRRECLNLNFGAVTV